MAPRKDYDLLAREVPCPRCYAVVGARCNGTLPGTRVKYTHVERRVRAAEARREEARHAR